MRYIRGVWKTDENGLLKDGTPPPKVMREIPMIGRPPLVFEVNPDFGGDLIAVGEDDVVEAYMNLPGMQNKDETYYAEYVEEGQALFADKHFKEIILKNVDVIQKILSEAVATEAAAVGKTKAEMEVEVEQPKTEVAEEAEIVTEVVIDVPEIAEDEKRAMVARASLMSMKMPELHRLRKSFGVKWQQGTRKTELVEALLSHYLTG